MWNFPDLYISRTEGKFSGFLSKKYSGGSPGVYSSQSSRISSMLLDDINLPNLVLGYLTKLSLHPWNLVPPTSKIIYCLGLNSSTKHSSLHMLEVITCTFNVRVNINSFPRVYLVTKEKLILSIVAPQHDTKNEKTVTMTPGDWTSDYLTATFSSKMVCSICQYSHLLVSDRLCLVSVKEDTKIINKII